MMTWNEEAGLTSTPQTIPTGARLFSKGSMGDCLVRALKLRGIPYNYLSPAEITSTSLVRRRVVKFSINGLLYYFGGGTLRVSDPNGLKVPGPNINGATARFVWRKDLVKSFLRKHGFSVPQGAAFSLNSLSDAEAYFSALCPDLPSGVCMKPAADNRGRDVFVEVRDLRGFHAAFAAIAKHHKRVLIEEMVPGTVYRFHCFSGRVLAIRTSVPAHVEGDGTHSIVDLVAIKNAERRLNPAHKPYPLRLGRQERRFLRKDGLEINHVPESGRRVFLNDLSNLHQGADIIDATETVDPSYIELIENAVCQVPGLVHCGPDVIIGDCTLPATSDNYYILELNGNGPGFSGHHYPWLGQSRDVAGSMIDHLKNLSAPPRQQKKREIVEERTTRFPRGSTGDCFVQTLAARNIPHRYLSRQEITDPQFALRRVVAFDINATRYFFTGICLRVSDPLGIDVPGPIIDGQIGDFMRRKDLVKSRLKKFGFSVPKGRAFSRRAFDKAETYFKAFGPTSPGGACLKPVKGHEGDEVYIGIHDLPSFRSAFAAVSAHYKRILIEETVPGTVYRFTWIANRVVAVRFGLPANVEGDGIHTIAKLIDLKNRERRRNPCLRRHMLNLGQKEKRQLESVGLHAEAIPPPRQKVWLGSTSNRHQGADTIDATEEVHSSYVELVEKIMRLFPGSLLCGVDVVVEDPSAPASSNNYHVLELNCCPGFSAHHYPWRGQPRDVAGAILDYLNSR